LAPRLAFLSLPIAFLAVGCAAADLQIGDADALTIAIAAFPATSHDAGKLPGFGMITDPGGAMVGIVAVDRTTGDAWLAAVCREIVSGDPRMLRRGIRKRIGMSANRYRALRRRGPECDRTHPMFAKSMIANEFDHRINEVADAARGRIRITEDSTARGERLG
jgi:hypothetical protein